MAQSRSSNNMVGWGMVLVFLGSSAFGLTAKQKELSQMANKVEAARRLKSKTAHRKLFDVVASEDAKLIAAGKKKVLTGDARAFAAKRSSLLEKLFSGKFKKGAYKQTGLDFLLASLMGMDQGDAEEPASSSLVLTTPYPDNFQIQPGSYADMLTGEMYTIAGSVTVIGDNFEYAELRHFFKDEVGHRTATVKAVVRMDVGHIQATTNAGSLTVFNDFNLSVISDDNGDRVKCEATHSINALYMYSLLSESTSVDLDPYDFEVSCSFDTGAANAEYVIDADLVTQTMNNLISYTSAVAGVDIQRLEVSFE